MFTLPPFDNLPLDSAVSMLADMADLRTILQDNAVYVTTPKNAQRLKSEQKKNRGIHAETLRRDRVGPGVRGLVSLPSPVQIWTNVLPLAA